MSAAHQPAPYPDTESSAGLTISLPNRLRPAPSPFPPGQAISERVRVRRDELRQGLYWTLVTILPAGVFFSVVTGPAWTYLTLLAGLSDVWFGVLAALSPAAALLQVPTALFVQHYQRHRRRLFFVTSITHRLLWLVVGLVPLLFAPGLWSILFLVLAVGLSQALGHIGALCWQSWMADLVPPRRRGKFFGRRTTWFHFSMLAISLAVAWLLPDPSRQHDWATPVIVAALFAVAAIAGTSDILGFIFVPETPHRPTPRLHWVTQLLTPLRDPTFRPLLAFGMLANAGTALIWPFLYKHMLTVLHVDSYYTTLALQAAPLLAVMVLSNLWGRFLDRVGRKATLAVGVIGGTLATLGWFWVTAPWWWLALVITAVGQGLWNAVDQTYFNYMLRFSARSTTGGHANGSPSYPAAFNAGCALAMALAAVLGGRLAEALHTPDGAAWVAQVQAAIDPLQFSPYLLLLLISVVLRLVAATVFLPRLKDPTAPTAGRSLVLMGGVIAEAVGDVVRTPQRWLSRAGRER